MSNYQIGDALQILAGRPADSAQCCVTSPPYWNLRDYGASGQIGQEPTVEEYVDRLVEVFRGVRRVLHPSGTLFLNLGDCYVGARGGGQGKNGQMASRAASLDGARKRVWYRRAGELPAKNLIGVPWRVAFALQDDGWILRSDNIWHKPNPTPESVKDRPTRAHEYVFMFSKSRTYLYNKEALDERAKTAGRVVRAGAKRADSDAARASREKHPGPGAVKGTRNTRSVWTISPQPYKRAHFAVMPPKLAAKCILAGTRPGDVVIDPFLGSGTTGQVAAMLGRRWFGIELQAKYEPLIQERLAQVPLGLVPISYNLSDDEEP